MKHIFILLLFLFSILTFSSFAQFNLTQIETIANNEDYPTYIAVSKNNSIYTYFTKSGIKIYKDKKWNILNDQVKELKAIPISCFHPLARVCNACFLFSIFIPSCQKNISSEKANLDEILRDFKKYTKNIHIFLSLLIKINNNSN